MSVFELEFLWNWETPSGHVSLLLGRYALHATVEAFAKDLNYLEYFK